ncbi:hypothetical protein C4D60_Mb05t24980 [Musa balbisiana]|uniref:Thioredoxin domain-containing protein n=1 Tax=Musa balbisiana TaxID=52838 RepID=A0A4S8JYR2_MUSBA|nr:hypothetical protein C4D60_Mb05t24980 [Musa balbisiana]
MNSCSPFPNPVSNAAIAQPRDPTPSCPTPSFLLNPRSPPHVGFFCTHRMLSLKKRRSSSFLFDAVADGRSGEVVGTGGDADDDDDDLCPVDCVREFKTEEEFARILDKAKADGSLVVVDFYRASCGSCKYIEQGFSKLCKGSGDQQADVVFLKHNVIDEYDEQSEVAERLRIKMEFMQSVPLFQFYKNGVLLEAFPTRDKERIVAAILKYTSSS